MAKAKLQDAAQDAPTMPQDAPSAPVAVPQLAKVAKGISALTLARIASQRLGRPINDKRVRSVARESLSRFIERDGYTAHAYTPDEAAALLALMSSKGRGAGTVTQDEALVLITAAEASKGA